MAFPASPLYIFLGDCVSLRASKSHNWFKIYGDFVERVDFAYWWSFSNGGRYCPKNLYLHKGATAQKVPS